MTSEDNRPTEYCTSQVLPNGELDKSIGAWQACEQVAEVEDTACP